MSQLKLLRHVSLQTNPPIFVFTMVSSSLITLSLLSYLFFPSSSATPAFPPATSKVKLDLYYESLCPYSAEFIADHLIKIFQNGLMNFIDLKLVPWGKAKILANNTIKCQNGPLECELHTVEACAMHVWPDLKKRFSFIYCIERLFHRGNTTIGTQWRSCYGKLGLDSKPISECYGSGLGRQLHLKYGAETNALQPPHQYTPWVVVNGQPLYRDYKNFVKYICDAYKGKVLPHGCRCRHKHQTSK